MYEYNRNHFQYPRTTREAFNDGERNHTVKPWQRTTLGVIVRLPLYFIATVALLVAVYVAVIFLLGLFTAVFPS